MANANVKAPSAAEMVYAERLSQVQSLAAELNTQLAREFGFKDARKDWSHVGSLVEIQRHLDELLAFTR
jgi:hypothetical protein